MRDNCFMKFTSLQKKKVPRTLKRSFLIITVALMIIFGIGAAVISYVIFSDSLRSNAIHSAETNLQFMRNDIDSNLDSVMELALWSRTNTSVINYISSDPEGSSFNALTREAGDRLSEEYLGNSANPYISRIIITNSGNTKYLQRYLQTYYSVDLSVIERIKSLPYFDELISAPDYTFSIGVQEDPLTRSTPEKMLPVIRAIESAYSSDQIGFLYIQISFDMFTDPLTRFSAQEDTPVYLTIANESYLITDGRIARISQAPPTDPLDYADVVGSDTIVQDIREGVRPGLYVSTPLEADGCWLSLPIKTADTGNAVNGFLSILFIILLFVTVIGLLLMRLLNRSVTEPVTLLKQQLSGKGSDTVQRPGDLLFFHSPEELPVSGHGITQPHARSCEKFGHAPEHTQISEMFCEGHCGDSIDVRGEFHIGFIDHDKDAFYCAESEKPFHIAVRYC